MYVRNKRPTTTNGEDDNDDNDDDDRNFVPTFEPFTSTSHSVRTSSFAIEYFVIITYRPFNEGLQINVPDLPTASFWW